jgi:hypothetical protein
VVLPAVVLAASLGALSFLSAAAPPVESPATRVESTRPKWKRFKLAGLSPEARPNGAPAAEIALEELLDLNRSLVTLRLGRDCPLWKVGLGFDAAFRERFFLLSCGERLIARRMGEGERLRAGLVLEPEPGVRHRVSLQVKVPHPAERSLLRLEPLDGAPGARIRLSMADLIDRILRAGAVRRVEGRELVFFYLTDLDPSTSAPAATRTILVVERRGARSVGWPLAEASLPEGEPRLARLGDLNVVFLRSEGVLRVYRPESVSASTPAAASR